MHYRFYKEPYKGAKFLYFIKSDVGIGFKGFFVKKMDLEGILEIEENDIKTDYGYNFEAISIGVHFGKTYLWDSGVVLNYRIGYGFPIGKFSWLENEPKDANLIKNFYVFFAGFDGGLSLGYSF